jgi:hypothetical protein
MFLKDFFLTVDLYSMGVYCVRVRYGCDSYTGSQDQIRYIQ